MDEQKFAQELEAMLEQIDNAETDELSELSKIAGLDLSEDFVGVDLSGEDLSGENFASANFERANFKNANLKGITCIDHDNVPELYKLIYLTSLGYGDVDFPSDVLAFGAGGASGASVLALSSLNNNFLRVFSVTNFKYANFTRSNLTRAILLNADFSGANFTRANLKKANFIHANLKHTIFTKAKLSEAIFGFNRGINQKLRREFEARGAIFVDSPEDPAWIKSPIRR